MSLAPSREGVLTIPDRQAPTSIVVNPAEAVRRVVGPTSQLRTILLSGGTRCSSTELAPLLLPFASAENVRFVGANFFPRMERLHGLEHFEHLEDLSLVHTPGPLSTVGRFVMKRLKGLYVSANCSTDVSAAVHCTSLQKLEVSDGHLRRGQYQFVSTITTLRAVSFAMTHVACLSEVLGGLDLSKVDLSGSTVDSLATLQTMPRLRDVVLRGLRGKYSLEHIADTPIQRLDVSELRPKNVERSAHPLCSLEDLEFLSAEGVRFVPSSLQGLSSLKRLKTCTLHHRYQSLFPTDDRFSFIGGR